jgi:hypothetical protein
MKSLTIKLSDAQIARLEKRATASGFPDAATFASTLLAGLGEADAPLSVLTRLDTSSREKLEAMLLEGLGSGRSAALTQAEWSSIRSEVNRQKTSRTRSKAS